MRRQPNGRARGSSNIFTNLYDSGVETVFTIEVRKRGEKEDFAYEDVAREARVFHEDCGGDKVNWDPPAECGCPWIFRCLTCGLQTEVPSILDTKLKIMETAMDGSEREVGKSIRVVCQVQGSVPGGAAEKDRHVSRGRFLKGAIGSFARKKGSTVGCLADC